MPMQYAFVLSLLTVIITGIFCFYQVITCHDQPRDLRSLTGIAVIFTLAAIAMLAHMAECPDIGMPHAPDDMTRASFALFGIVRNGAMCWLNVVVWRSAAAIKSKKQIGGNYGRAYRSGASRIAGQY
jgi:hypothetical protein